MRTQNIRRAEEKNVGGCWCKAGEGASSACPGRGCVVGRSRGWRELVGGSQGGAAANVTRTVRTCRGPWHTGAGSLLLMSLALSHDQRIETLRYTVCLVEESRTVLRKGERKLQTGAAVGWARCWPARSILKARQGAQRDRDTRDGRHSETRRTGLAWRGFRVVGLAELTGVAGQWCSILILGSKPTSSSRSSGFGLCRPFPAP